MHLDSLLKESCAWSLHRLSGDQYFPRINYYRPRNTASKATKFKSSVTHARDFMISGKNRRGNL